ncbi:MAG: hypothetical protein ABEJ72_11370, partial [Candidatus Aenigmatarchaeota archaeon]
DRFATRPNDFDAVVEEGFKGRDWEKWLESTTDPEMFKELKSRVHTVRGNEYDKELVKEADSVREALVPISTYQNYFEVIGEDGTIDEKQSKDIIGEAPKKAALYEAAIREVTDFENFKILTHPMHQGANSYDNSENPEFFIRENDLFPAFTILDGETGQVVNVEVYGYGDEELIDQDTFFREQAHIFDEERKGQWQKYNTLIQDSMFLPYFGKEDQNRRLVEKELPEGDPFLVSDIADGVAASEWWHPARFGGYEPDGRFYPEGHFGEGTGPDDRENPPWSAPTYDEVPGMDYERAARLAGTMVRRTVSSTIDDDISTTVMETDSFAMTNEYLTNIVREFRTIGDTEDYELVEAHGEIIHKALEEAE